MRRLHALGLLLAFATACAEPAPAPRPERVLFLGNSITKHGPAPKIGWTDDWGMAASALEKDYVHLVAAGLAARRGIPPEVMALNIADFERTFATYDLEARLKPALDFKPTRVIVAIGENVPALGTPESQAQFRTSLGKLLGALKNSALIVRSCFWADPTKDGILRKACAEAGGTFVDIGALGRDESHYARSERSFTHAGVAAHPGDKGMKAIAEAILNAVPDAGK